MMKYFLAISFCFYVTISVAQSPLLLGMSRLGGTSAGGSIFKVRGDGSNFSVLHNFIDGTQPYGSLLQANDGKLYGLTSTGGQQGAGALFSIDTTGNYVELFSFSESDGYNPHGNLIQASNGKLYGAAMYGGTGNCGSYKCGTIFCYDIGSASYTKIVDLSGSDGHFPCGSLVEANDGNLYCMTQFGGIYGHGNLIKIDPLNDSVSNLHNFSNYANPQGNVVQAQDGKLYGMTLMSGSGTGCGGTGCGTIFSFDISNNVYAHLYDFDSLGAYPMGSLVEGSNGLLYGVTVDGGDEHGGVLFSFNPTNNSYTKWYDFSPSTGSGPKGSLMQASDANLYGMTNGGCDGPLYGVLFRFDVSNNMFTVIHTCALGEDCSEPDGNDFIEFKAFTNVNDGIIPLKKILVYPNPSPGWFIVDVNNTDATIDLFNINGEAVFEKEVNGKDKVDVATLDNGIYTLAIKNNLTVSYRKLLIAH